MVGDCQSLWPLILGTLLCASMTFGVGANDLANVMSATMGSKALSTRQAIAIAVVFELLGAFLGGGGVTETIRSGIIDFDQLQSQPCIIISGMLSILMAVTAWLNLASCLGLPVSITNAIVGSVVGFGVVVLGVTHVHWQCVTSIAVGWVTSPLIAGVIAFLVMKSIQLLIFSRGNPLTRALKWFPMYLFFVGLVLSFMIVFKGMQHFQIQCPLWLDALIVFCSGVVVAVVGQIYLISTPLPTIRRRRQCYIMVEKQFGFLVALTTCAMVFAHGANDVSIAVGPLMVIFSFLRITGHLWPVPHTPPYLVTALGCVGVIVGLVSFGRKVIGTVGSSITALTPSRAFAAVLAAAFTVVVATSSGIPVSATQTLVGSVLGVGLARGIGALNLVVIRNIFMSWIVTLPASSLFTVLCYAALRLGQGHSLLG